jgi:hypothetical protein
LYRKGILGISLVHLWYILCLYKGYTKGKQSVYVLYRKCIEGWEEVHRKLGEGVQKVGRRCTENGVNTPRKRGEIRKKWSQWLVEVKERRFTSPLKISAMEEKRNITRTDNRGFLLLEG